MPIFNAEECDVLEAMTTPGFEFARELAHAEGIDLGLRLMGDQADNPASVILLRMPPGHVLERHAHDAHRVEIVVQGSIILPDGRVLRSGDVSTSGPREFYGPLTAGEEGSLTIEIFGSAAGLVPIPEEGNADSASVTGRVRASFEASTTA